MYVITMIERWKQLNRNLALICPFDSAKGLSPRKNPISLQKVIWEIVPFKSSKYLDLNIIRIKNLIPFLFLNLQIIASCGMTFPSRRTNWYFIYWRTASKLNHSADWRPKSGWLLERRASNQSCLTILWNLNNQLRWVSYYKFVGTYVNRITCLICLI